MFHFSKNLALCLVITSGSFAISSTANSQAANGNATLTIPKILSHQDEFTTRDGKKYKNVTIKEIDSEGMYIEYTPEGGGVGLGKIKFDDLPKDIQGIYEGYHKLASRKAREHYEHYVQQAAAVAEKEAPQIKILTEIVSDYHRLHTYLGKDIFVCGDMASDVWNILKTKGFNAKICIGNVKKDRPSMLDVDHAWVMAETSPGRWFALETTGGYVVKESQNRRYYFGHLFANPKELKEYTTLLRQAKEAKEKYENAANDYNRLIGQYNATSNDGKSELLSDLNRKASVLKERTTDLNEITEALRVLLSKKS